MLISAVIMTSLIDSCFLLEEDDIYGGDTLSEGVEITGVSFVKDEQITISSDGASKPSNPSVEEDETLEHPTGIKMFYIPVIVALCFTSKLFKFLQIYQTSILSVDNFLISFFFSFS